MKNYEASLSGIILLKNIIKQKSSIVLATTSFAFAAQLAFAADIPPFEFNTSDQSKNIASAEHIASAAIAAIQSNGAGLTGLSIVVNASANNGIAGVNQRAIDIAANDSLSSIALNSGRITSNFDRTIFLQGNSTATLSMGANTTISNSATSGTIYAIDAKAMSNISIAAGAAIRANAGSNVNATALNIVDNSSAFFFNDSLITNYGEINAGSGKALNLQSANSLTGYYTLRNYSTGLITGDIISSVKQLTLWNSSAINGNIIQNSTDASSEMKLNFTNGGVFSGNIETVEGSLGYTNLQLDGNSSMTGNVFFRGARGSIQLQNNALLTGNVAGVSSANHGVTILGGQIVGDIAGHINTIVSGSERLNFDYTLAGNIEKTFAGSIVDLSAPSVSFTLSNSANVYNAAYSIYTDVIEINGAPNSLDRASTLYVGTGEIIVENINVNGTLDLSSSNKAITGTGNINNNATGNVKLGQYSSTNSGAFTALSGATVSATITSPTAIGNNNSGELVTTSATSNIAIAVDYNQDSYNSGKTYNLLLGGAGSNATINGVIDSHISINGATGALSNRSGVLNYRSAQSGNNLILYVVKDDKALISNNISEQNVYEAVDVVGSGMTGELKAMQNYIMTSNSTNAAQRQDALQSLTPNDTGLNKTVFDSAVNSARLVGNRLEEIRDLKRINSRFKQQSQAKIVDKNGDELAESEFDSFEQYAAANNVAKRSSDASSISPYKEEAVDKGIWAQTFATSSKQDRANGFNGYDSTLMGLSIGADKKLRKDIVVGASLTASKSKIDAATNLKNTDIDSYQLNIYAGQSCERYFIDAIAGIILNKYDSKREMSVIGETAKAKYNGQTYIAKLKSGYIMKFKNSGFEMTPETSLTYARNAINSYNENGAGTANLRVQAKSANFLEAEAGVRFGYNALIYKSAILYPSLKLSYGYDIIGNKQTATSTFIGQPVSFDTQSSKINRSSFKLDAGVNVYAKSDVSVSANYLMETKRAFVSHSLALRVSYSF